MDKKTSKNMQKSLETYKISGLSYSLAVGLPVALALVLAIIVAAFQLSTTKETVGGEVTKDWYIYLSFLIPQIALALTAVFCQRRAKVSVLEKAKEQICKPKYFLLAIIAQIGLLSLSGLNTRFLKWLGEFGYVDPGISLPSLDGFGLFATLIVVALLPAVFEELLFRGLLLNGLKKSFSDWAAALICGGLFALFHQNPAQTPYQFCCGTVYALVAIKSGSILPMMLAHFLNNASIIIFYKFGIANFDKTTSIIVFCVSIAALIFSFVWLFVLDRQEKEREGKEGIKPFFLYASFGIIVSLFAWGLMLVNGL